MVSYTGFFALVHPVPSFPFLSNWICVIGSLCAGAAALLFCLVLIVMVMRAPAGSAEMQRISGYIQEGAQGFLKAEYTAVAAFTLLVALGLGFSTFGYADGWKTMVCFLFGSVTSGAAGAIGMLVATRANVRTCAAAVDKENGLNNALRIAFNSGSVMGLVVCGLGIFNLSWLFLLFPNFRILSGYGFGASAISIFARIGGGIFTKAADVGSDLVGKVEAGIPEDDPRNPGTIADNVGDNVGDVAGMGADLFGSFVGSTIAAGALGTDSTVPAYTHSPLVALPFWIASAGIVASMIGVLLVRTREHKREQGMTSNEFKLKQQGSLLWSIRFGVFAASFIVAGLAIACVLVLGITMRVWGCMAIGLAAGIAIGLLTEYSTSFAYGPTQAIARAGSTGPATVIIEGLSVGMWSAVPPLLIITTVIICCMYLAGPYGMAIASVGMLSTLGVTLATDAYGPVADNAGGIAEMASDVPEYVRDRTDALDALGNTTAATGKGFAIGSAVLTAFSYMIAYAQNTGIDTVDLISDIMVIPGLLLGAMIPFAFSSLTMKAVGRAAMSIVEEVRRQFREIPGLREGKPDVVADHQRCVDISTKAALRQMVLPALLPIIFVIVTGLLLGSKALAALVAGSIITSFMLGVTMANAGGAWDNAKKYVEGGGIEGHAKGSDLHKAAVVGDTIGDPFKDTSGPALNIMIKLMSVLSLMLSPLFGQPWPFQPPHYWVGIIIGGFSLLVGIIIRLVARKKKERRLAAKAAAAATSFPPDSGKEMQPLVVVPASPAPLMAEQISVAVEDNTIPATPATEVTATNAV